MQDEACGSVSVTVRLERSLAERLTVFAGGRRGGKSAAIKAALEAYLAAGGDPAGVVVATHPAEVRGSVPRGRPKFDALAARQAALNKPKGM